jgi:hypothetical protein
MSVEEFSEEKAGSETMALLRLRVVAESDPGALVRVLERLQNLNVTPRRVIAEASSADRLYIEVDIVGLSEGRVSLIAAKVGQDACVFNAYWHHV